MTTGAFERRINTGKIKRIPMTISLFQFRRPQETEHYPYFSAEHFYDILSTSV